MRTTKSVLAQLHKRHGDRLKSNETFVSACDGFGASQAHPIPLTASRREANAVRTPEEIMHENAAAYRRVAAVQLALGMPIDEPLGELPFSKDGYVLAHTNARLFVFDGSGKNYLLQAQVKGMWLQTIDHRDGMFTLVFHRGDDTDEKVAVATRIESIELTRDFINSFPDRRDQPRTIILTDAQTTVTF